MLDKKGLTLTMIFKASSLNYGESLGNTSMLKTVTLMDGNQYARVSRQALLYDIRNQMGGLAPLGQDASDKSVIQYASDATVDKYPEVDLFGYMKTEKGNNSLTRSAVARFSDAIALTPFKNDEDFLTNMGLAKRIADQTGKEHKNSLASSQIDSNFYAYTVTVDLDKVGVDENDGINIPSKEKASRVNRLLDAINNQYRDIRGRREDLHPVFVIGGVYTIKRPFFMNAVKYINGKLDTDLISSSIDSAGEYLLGIEPGYFNEAEDIKTGNVDSTFDKIKHEVDDYYA